MDAATLTARLEDARRGLLDLSTRNRLLALPKPGRSRGVVIIEREDADFVVPRLIDGDSFGFEAAGETPPETPPAPAEPGAKPRRAPRRTKAKAEGVAVADAAKTEQEWQADDRLRVYVPPAELTRRLRDLMTDARTAREETGIATLSLAIGTLAWRDPTTPQTERKAPLALLPVTLERQGVSQNFRIRSAGLEMQENLSLRQKLAAVTSSGSRSRSKDFTTSQATTQPTATPPSAASAKSTGASSRATPPAQMAATAKR